jgi:leucine dehydrogenase
VIEDLIDRWDGEATIVSKDHPTGAWFVIAVHSTALGPSAGGCRMRVYDTPADAVRDAHRLSAAMTRKFAVNDLPIGGGKSVLAVPALPSGEERAGLLRRFARLVDSLGGLYAVGPDMNTSASDMDVIGEVTRHVHCRTEAAGGTGSTAPDTANGVYSAIRATVAHLFGSDDLAGRSVVIQGVGAVGALLATRLAGEGAKVTVGDVDGARAAAVAATVGARVVDPADVLTEPCDVLSPCATGGVLHEGTIPALRCRAVVGAANNQLAEPADAERLHAAGILWAPDFVANSGGVFHGGGYDVLGWPRDRVDASVAAIGDRLRAMYEEAERKGVPPVEVAEAMADLRLAAARREPA